MQYVSVFGFTICCFASALEKKNTLCDVLRDFFFTLGDPNPVDPKVHLKSVNTRGPRLDTDV